MSSPSPAESPTPTSSRTSTYWALVGVLVLIDQHVPEATPVVLGDVGKQLEQRDRRPDQVIEVECIGLQEAALVIRVDVGQLQVFRSLRLRARVVEVDQLVLQVADLRGEGAGGLRFGSRSSSRITWVMSRCESAAS